MEEQKWEIMLANVGLRPQDQPDSEEFSSSSNTTVSPISAFGKSDFDKRSVNRPIGHDNRKDRVLTIDSGDGDGLTFDSTFNK